MSPQKFHIGENGPAPCSASIRACKYKVEGSLEEMNVVWERQQEEEFSKMLIGATKSSIAGTHASVDGGDPVLPSAVVSNADLELQVVRKALGNELKYFPDPDSRVMYYANERKVAMKLALDSIDSAPYALAKSKDERWSSNGLTDVQRYELSDGSVGYFKSLRDNSLSERCFRAYGTNSLAACISEANSYRMSQVMGEGFSRLVPETAIREIDGEIGSFQREVKESENFEPDYSDYKGLREDYRKAAIFDFVIGNLDRHHENFLYGEQGDEFRGHGSRPAIRLIDNSMAFPKSDAIGLNASIFSRNEPPIEVDYWDETEDSEDNYQGVPSQETDLKLDEIEALMRAKRGVQDWISAGTIMKDNGDATVARIDFMLKKKALSNIGMYFSENELN